MSSVSEFRAMVLSDEGLKARVRSAGDDLGKIALIAKESGFDLTTEDFEALDDDQLGGISGGTSMGTMRRI